MHKLLNRRIFLFNKNIINNTSRQLSSTEKHVFRNSFDKDLERVYDSFKEKIHFNSFYEDSFIKMGYKQNKIMSNIATKREKKEILNRIKVKPFPLALQFLQKSPEVTTDSNISEVEELDNRMKDNIMNISQSQSKLDVSKPESYSWMKDYEYFDESETSSEYGTPGEISPLYNHHLN